MMTEANRAAYEANREAFSAAYAATKQLFELTAKQRDVLDASSAYPEIMRAAVNEEWIAVYLMLILNGIITEKA